jgi:hypothetical protein
MNILNISLGIGLMWLGGVLAKINDDYSENGCPPFWVGIGVMLLGGAMAIISLAMELF